MSQSPWELEDPSSYSADKFYTKAGENSVSKGVRFPQRISRMIAVMIQSGEYPKLQTHGDVVRDAVYHRLHYLNDHKPGSDPFLRLIRAHQDQADYAQQMAALQQVINEIAQAVTNMRTRGHYEPADRMLHNIFDEVEGMEDSYWRTYYLQQLQARFGM